MHSVVHFDVQRTEILSEIENRNGFKKGALFIDNGAVFYYENDALLCFCVVDSVYWNEITSQIQLSKFLKNLV